MAQMTREQVTEIFKHLDIECYNCGGSGKAGVTVQQGPWRTQIDCDVCYGTGYQATGAGIALLEFLQRQQKRIEKEQL